MRESEIEKRLKNAVKMRGGRMWQVNAWKSIFV